MTDFTPLETAVKDVTALPLMHPGRPVGRDDLLKEIFTHLQNRRPVLLHGAAGVGKTALAISSQQEQKGKSLTQRRGEAEAQRDFFKR